ncbi:DUF6708 domain-containing protein [Achromobacter spanius]|uniref:DUF6708 domain-containing protein n=1 Tax=Achromobacter spanius TaxID=217203 RepID=A0AA42LRW1_9BURK|nr:DUF6708 domain-containing protein [Achromobacter spanius]MDH0738330.1 hypothetical protein [Achromobacter spanius]
MARSKLVPSCQGWQRDLPGPNEKPVVTPSAKEYAPNHIDDIYLELSRRSSSLRGALLIPILVLGYCAFIQAPSVIFSVLWSEWSSFDSFDLFLVLSGLFITVLCAWASAFMYRTDIHQPRDLPIRFNRARRKIYVYGFHMVWWNPLSHWYVTTASHDWDDVRAEVWQQWGATAGGGLIIKWGVSLAIVKPGTNEVIERFHLSTYNQDLDNLWAYVCTYMQQGPEALPPCDIEPRDANDVPAYNLALRWAPRVVWPEAMDAESRSAP